MAATAPRTNPEQYLAEARKRRAEFIRLIREQEAFANADPAAYRRKVLLMAYGGYAYILGMLILVCLAFALLIWIAVVGHYLNGILIKLMIIIVPIIWAILRSLFVKIPPPEGVTLTREEAPELYRVVEEVGKKVGDTSVDTIVIDENCNAAAYWMPKYGLFGPPKKYLILGLPLLLTLSPEEARYVIGHEFGHFSGEHGRFGGWIYRLNRTWSFLQSNLNRQGGNLLFAKFFNWFEPRFDAVSFALRRANEYEADAAALKVASPEHAASALMRFRYAVPHLSEHFWRPLFRRARFEERPPEHPLSDMPEIARAPADPEFVERRIRAELAEKTGYADTHPALSDRLRAMGQIPSDPTATAIELAKGFPQSAAEAFLGPRIDAVVAKVNSAYVKQIESSWGTMHGRYAEQRRALTTLREKLLTMPPSRDEEIDLALLTHAVEENDDSFQLLQRTAEKHPDHASLQFTLGDALLDKEDAEGVRHLEEARRLQPSLSPKVLARLASYYEEQGEAERVEQIQEEHYDAATLANLAKQEARRFALTDDFVPVHLRPHEAESIVRQLEPRQDVGVAFLVSKLLPSRPDQPQALLVVFPKKKMLEKGDEGNKLVAALVKELRFPGTVMVFAPQDRKNWRRRMEQIPGSCVLDREK